jgi:hypothetical protein
MTFTTTHQICYAPLPPEKEYAYKAALLGLYEMLTDAMEEIDEEERERGKEKETPKKWEAQ